MFRKGLPPEVDGLARREVLQIVEYRGRKYAIHPKEVRTRWGTRVVKLFARKLKKVV